MTKKAEIKKLVTKVYKQVEASRIRREMRELRSQLKELDALSTRKVKRATRKGK